MLRSPAAPVAPNAADDRRRLVDEHLTYVRSIAARVKETLPREVELDELVGYGTQGLLEAAERWDGAQASFTTFAYYRVRGAIFDGLRRMGWLSRSEYGRAQERAGVYLEDRAAREGDGGDERSLEEELRDLAGALGGVAAVFLTSLGAQHEEALPDPAEAPSERIERRQSTWEMRELVARLPPRERRLIELYYFEEKSLQEAGALLGLSKSWTSRVHARAVERLASELAKRGAAPPKPGRRPRARR